MEYSGIYATVLDNNQYVVVGVIPGSQSKKLGKYKTEEETEKIIEQATLHLEVQQGKDLSSFSVFRMP